MTAAEVGYTMFWQLSRDGSRDSRGLTVTLPVRTQSENNMRDHPMARHRRRKAQRTQVGRIVGVLLKLEPVAAPWCVELTRVAPRELDGDNLQGSLKAVRDAVADALGVDDRDRRVRWEYDQQKGAVRQYAIRVTIRTEVA